MAIYHLRIQVTTCTALQAYTLFDFLPVNATSPVTAASLLAGGKWPGLKRERELKRRPAYRHQALIGEAIVPQVYFGHISQLSPQNVQCSITLMLRGTPHGLFFCQSVICFNSSMLAWAAAQCTCCRQYWRCSVRLAATCAEIPVGPDHRTNSQAADAARRFNETWDSDIQLLRHDCHHHTAALVESLTGESIDVWRLFPVHQRTVWL